MKRSSYTESALGTLTEGMVYLRRSLSSKQRKKLTLSAFNTSGTLSVPVSPTKCVHPPRQLKRSCRFVHLYV
ncbi:hypothetical protein DPMN_191909 [Dreissena polymorpha]|uniref:Uncharacterized protein n=1 Tax=Dreissena polymorpha TaxID=45954 RepID=A0A9D3XY21_DREPO|nr:hypothetical protein DPMN_191909 [Dreissena polymorpha]